MLKVLLLFFQRAFSCFASTLISGLPAEPAQQWTGLFLAGQSDPFKVCCSFFYAQCFAFLSPGNSVHSGQGQLLTLPGIRVSDAQYSSTHLRYVHNILHRLGKSLRSTRSTIKSSP